MSLYHLVRKPLQPADKNPLLLLIHGYGSNEEDLFSFAEALPAEYFVVSVRAPYDLSYGGFAWYAINFTADEKKFSDLDQARESVQLLSGFIDTLVSEYAIDPNEVTLIGFSQGAILSYAVALNHPEKVRRVAAMSGYLNQDLLQPGFENNDLRHLRFFISHGNMDQVVPLVWAQKAAPFLENIGVQAEYHEYPAGHGVAPKNFQDLLDWLDKA